MDIDKIYNMDCLEGMKQLEDNSVDMVLTSPPYDNLRTYDNDIDKSWGEHVWKPIIAELFRVIKQGGVCVWVVNDATINGSETGTSFRQALYAMECGFKLFDTMIYQKKPRGAVGCNKGYWQTFEYMFVFSKGNPSTINLIKDRRNKDARKGDKGTKRLQDGTLQHVERGGYEQYGRRTNVWEYSIGNSQRKEYVCNWHPAQFPFLLAHDHIITWSNYNDVVLDPFIGSGTTAIACIREKRHFIGFETNEEYYKKACERIKKERKEIENSLFYI